MPVYEYECRECGKKFEKIQGIFDRRRPKCPKCAGRVARLMGRGQRFILRGAGFHCNDYKGK